MDLVNILNNIESGMNRNVNIFLSSAHFVVLKRKTLCIQKAHVGSENANESALTCVKGVVLPIQSVSNSIQ